VVDRYAVIGNPIRHSKSPTIHREFARQTGIALEYEVIECPPDQFQQAVQTFRAQGGRGMNVTAQFKLQALELADAVSDRVRVAGSVNTLKFEGGLVLADNFDGIGLVIDLRDNLGFPIAGTRVLVLGAGGAARGILGPLVEERPAELVLANRAVERARQAVATLPDRDRVRGGGYDEIGADPFDLVINATSASMHDERPPIGPSVFRPEGMAYDLAYGRGLTPFLALGQEAGAARIVDGVGMLVEQAAESFAWWHGIRPSTRAMIEHLTVPLA
jgi:shikimate dehydrogenase